MLCAYGTPVVPHIHTKTDLLPQHCPPQSAHIRTTITRSGADVLLHIKIEAGQDVLHPHLDEVSSFLLQERGRSELLDGKEVSLPLEGLG